jgi:hypothetical protein
MTITYAYEGFAPEKPSVSTVWIKCRSERIEEGRKFARLDLRLTILYAIHEGSAKVVNKVYNTAISRTRGRGQSFPANAGDTKRAPSVDGSTRDESYRQRGRGEG